MQYANNGQPLKLTWDAVVKQFTDLCKFAAKQRVTSGNHTDSMTSAEDLYQEGMIKLYECWEIWCVDKNKDMDEFGPIFRKSLFRVMKKDKSVKPNFVDIEDTANSLKDESAIDTVDRMYQEEGLEKLAESLSPIARRLLAELEEPSANTLFQVWADIERKKMLKSQGKRVNIPKDNTVRMKHIVRSLQISDKQYDVAILEIRDKARMFIER